MLEGIKLSLDAVHPDTVTLEHLTDKELAAPAVNWATPYTIPQETQLIVKNQEQTDACTSFSTSYKLEVENLVNGNLYRQFSPAWTYSNTFMAAGGSSELNLVIPFLQKTGSVSLADYPLPNPLTETAIRLKTGQDTYLNNVASFMKVGQPMVVSTDINSIASAIQAYGGVLAGFYLDDGWASFNVPSTGIVPVATSQKYAHEVFLTGYATINGAQYIRHIGSWGTTWGDGGFGYIPVNYFENGYIIGALALPQIPNNFIVTPSQYSYVWNTNLSLGLTSPDIKALQDVLKIEGVMAQSVPSTGYFGPLTRNSIDALQLKYASQILGTSTTPTGILDAPTRTFLNSKY